jgi:hypothetical protein
MAELLPSKLGNGNGFRFYRFLTLPVRSEAPIRRVY